MSLAVIYARFSCSKQREESIEDQVRVCREAAERAGDTVVHVYADAAQSGRTDARPEFQRMVADSAKRTFEVVYIYKSDRFARNRYDSAINKGKLKRNGVHVVCAAEPIPDGPEGVLLESLYEGMAEYYSANLSENVKRGIEGKALKRLYNGGYLLYGYTTDGAGHYVPDPDEAHIVKMVFEMYAAGRSYADIIAAVKALGPIGRPKKWSYSTVGALLRKEQYRGVYTYAGHRVEDGMPRIVDDETWERARARVGTRNHICRADYERYALSGKLRDAEGRRFVGTAGTSRNGTRYHYYKCLETGKTYVRDDLDLRIAAAVAAELAVPGVADLIADIVLEGIDEEEADAVAAADAMRDEIARTDRALDRLVDAICERGSDERIMRKMEELERHLAEARVELAELERGAPTVTRDMVLFWVHSISTAPDTDALLDFITEAVVDDADNVTVAFVLDETKNANHPGEDGSHKCRLVDHSRVGANIAPLVGGFCIRVAA